MPATALVVSLREFSFSILLPTDMEVTNALPVPLDEQTLLSFFGTESSSELESPPYLDGTTPSFEDLLAETTPTEPLFPSLDLSSLPVHQTQPSSPSESEEQELQEINQTKTPKKRNTATNQKQNKRPLKKQKVESEFIRSLQGLTSDQLIEYEQTHSLNAVQQRELKNWIRKIKNRESALFSRQRKKSYQEELEQRIEFLKKENARLERETLKLEAQNSVLKSEFVEFQKMISSSTFLSKMFSQSNMQHPHLQNISYPLQNAATTNDLRLQFDSVLQNIAESPAGLDTDKMSNAQLDAYSFLYMCIMLYSYAQHYASLTNKPVLENDSNSMPIAVQ